MYYRILSALLGYPDAALREALPEIRAAMASLRDLTPCEREALAVFLAKLEALAAADPTAAEEDYVRTFDMVPEHSLHLTHHLLGEDRNRGPALIDLGEFYKDCGFGISARELPDYLPLMLEFVSLLEAEEAKVFLSRWNKVLRQLCANLEEAGSGYAGLVRLVEMRGRLVEQSGHPDAPAAAAKTDPCLDDGDFDPPVSWSTPACGAPCSL